MVLVKNKREIFYFCLTKMKYLTKKKLTPQKIYLNLS